MILAEFMNQKRNCVVVEQIPRLWSRLANEAKFETQSVYHFCQYTAIRSNCTPFHLRGKLVREIQLRNNRDTPPDGSFVSSILDLIFGQQSTPCPLSCGQHENKAFSES